MASHTLHLFVLILACSYLISSNAIPMSRLSSLSKEGKEFVATRIMKQDQIISKEEIEDGSIEDKMDFVKNDYGPPTSNPIHTPRPPRT